MKIKAESLSLQACAEEKLSKNEQKRRAKKEIARSPQHTCNLPRPPSFLCIKHQPRSCRLGLKSLVPSSIASRFQAVVTFYLSQRPDLSPQSSFQLLYQCKLRRITSALNLRAPSPNTTCVMAHGSNLRS